MPNATAASREETVTKTATSSVVKGRAKPSAKKSSQTIEIDGITFTIICKSEQHDEFTTGGTMVYYKFADLAKAETAKAARPGLPPAQLEYYLNSRDMVCFTSSELPGVYLYAYRSSSELGIWRLGYIRYGDCGFFKGQLDYVQGTLLHHKLIGLINKLWKTIPHINLNVIQNHPGLCYAQEYNITTHQPGLIYCLTAPFADANIVSMIDSPNRCSECTGAGRGNFFTDFFRSNGSIFDTITITCANQNKDTLKKMYEQLTACGNILETHFDYVKGSCINQYKFIEAYAGINATIDVCTNNLYRKNTETLAYILVSCTYTANYGGKYQATGCYGIALLPSSFKVTSYGIYSQYVKANLFICKPFFYRSMCDFKDSITQCLRCANEYIYSGFIYSNCWPYSKIATWNYSNPELYAAITKIITTQEFKVDNSQLSLHRIYNQQGGNKSHKKRKTQRKKTNRKTQKRRSYSIFRSNK